MTFRHIKHPSAQVTARIFLVSISVSFVVADWAFAVWAVIPTVSRVMDRRLTNRRHAAAGADAADRKAA
jgi:hypothetical protein